MIRALALLLLVPLAAQAGVQLRMSERPESVPAHTSSFTMKFGTVTLTQPEPARWPRPFNYPYEANP